MDRIDIRIDVERTNLDTLNVVQTGKSSAQLRDEITVAKAFAQSRQAKQGLVSHSPARSGRGSTQKQGNKLLALLDQCNLSAKANDFLNLSVKTSKLNTRSVIKMLSLARTIADLDESFSVEEKHLAEAYTLRFRQACA
jgi:magnesium chelatase family protein